MTKKSWYELFENTPWFIEKNDNEETYIIEDLLAFNGHSVSKTAIFKLENWENLIKKIKNNMNYNENKKYKILDVGCGAGAMLKYFEKNDIYGIDPSKKYIKIIRKAIPNGEYINEDALEIKKFQDNFFDFIICYSTTQYFMDKNYFKYFIELCYKKLKIGGIIFVGDILDLDLKKEYIDFRINTIGREKFKELYTDHNLDHLYISRTNINTYLENFNSILIEDSQKRGCEELSYRFDIYYQKLNSRFNNILTNNDTMEYLYTIKDFPVSLSCVPLEFNKFKKLDMIFDICKETGNIQIRNAPPLEDIYIKPHNTSYGDIWKNLYKKFNILLKKYIKKGDKILEIGAGALMLASKILNNKDILEYIVYEKNLNLNYTNDKRIKIINSYFTQETKLDKKYNFYIHSHVLEHVWNPKEFIECISKSMNNGEFHCFIVPNLKKTLSNKYTNALDFEHNFFIIEEYIDIILFNNNFVISEKEFYIDHSILYITKKIENKNLILKKFPNLYEENKKIALDFYNYYKEFIVKVNKQINNFNGELYLFGGTGFSIYLICFGLNTDKIIYILDNDPEKNNKKVYGTNFIVKNPIIIKNKKNVAVIVKAASYQIEIEEQLLKINSNILIIK